MARLTDSVREITAKRGLPPMAERITRYNARLDEMGRHDIRVVADGEKTRFVGVHYRDTSERLRTLQQQMQVAFDGLRDGRITLDQAKNWPHRWRRIADAQNLLRMEPHEWYVGNRESRAGSPASSRDISAILKELRLPSAGNA